uniref:Uncharacterized protein n=1 Tax=Anguilla anguilla TaxID=7936 RepID=A0A0E9X109_ANGAN
MILNTVNCMEAILFLNGPRCKVKMSDPWLFLTSVSSTITEGWRGPHDNTQKNKHCSGLL